MKQILLLSLLAFSSNSMAEWVEYSARANGDVHFYDSARVETNEKHINVWERVRFKTSLMGASSHQSFLEIDCSEGSETTLRSTFYSDKDWTTPAMAPNTKAKPKKRIKASSALEELANILCKD